MSERQTTPSAPPRVLVVENDPGWRQDHLKNLEAWGYEPYAAEPAKDAPGSFQSLWEDAIAKAKRHRCHIALVDMRLRDDDDPSDTSGLKLAPELAPTVSIIVSGKGDVRTVRAALKSPPEVPERAYDFVGKEDGPEVLLTIIQEVEKTIWCRRPVEIDCPDELCSEALIKRIFPGDDTVPSDEVDDILRRLFPKARRLKVEPVDAVQQTAGVLLRRRSAVIKVTEDAHTQPAIVKLARSGRIKDEIERFRQVNSYVPAVRYAEPRFDPVELWDLGGVEYQLIGSKDLAQFSDYFLARRVSEIEEVLTRLIGALRPLYLREPRDTRKTLFEAYSEILGSDWHRSLRENQHGLELSLPESLPGIENPVAWLVRRLRLSETASHHDTTPCSKLGLIHGSLNGDNILVNERSDVWLIDFGRTGFGPILYDFTELEFDILTRLAEMESEPVTWYELLLAILEPVTARSPISSTTLVINSSKARKALSVIMKLRQLAYDAMRDPDKKDTDEIVFDQREYLWCLLLHSIIYMSLSMSASVAESAISQRRRAYSLAAMICHRLDNWHRAWPPREWEHSEWKDSQSHKDRVSDIDNLYARRDGLEYQLRIASLDSGKIVAEIEQIDRHLIEYGETPPNSGYPQ